MNFSAARFVSVEVPNDGMYVGGIDRLRFCI